MLLVSINKDPLVAFEFDVLSIIILCVLRVRATYHVWGHMGERS